MTNDKKMKSSKIKRIVVECKLKDSKETKEYDVDPEIFDDFLLEAATRFAEDCVKKPKAKITSILTAYDKVDSKNFEKHYCFNSYYLLINAGQHKKAEIMRKNFMAATQIDLQKENLKTQDGQLGTN